MVTTTSGCKRQVQGRIAKLSCPFDKWSQPSCGPEVSFCTACCFQAADAMMIAAKRIMCRRYRSTLTALHLLLLCRCARPWVRLL